MEHRSGDAGVRRIENEILLPLVLLQQPVDPSAQLIVAGTVRRNTAV
jgi:hypothetical protein